MKAETTTLQGVIKFKIDIFEDHRGKYVELYNKREYWQETGVEFVCDDISMSSRNVLRGIHGDGVNWKLVSCIEGKIYLVVVDCDTESKDFGKWESFLLSENNGVQVLIPPKYGLAHLVLSDRAIFHYKQSSYYDPSKQFTYRYDDVRFNIWWPIGDYQESMRAVQTPILSKRDAEGHYVS